MFEKFKWEKKSFDREDVVKRFIAIKHWDETSNFVNVYIRLNQNLSEKKRCFTKIRKQKTIWK